ncbi:hypothetical protein D6D10_09863 [Aureobasidium pullulans]|uniref:DUF7730 domain-containing protein n=1 Tax=Aureobasidium pullulans TaxID=5580 RepID=A0A4S9DWK5_AURPU|nr:hypothetical protein D6D10_09863 [Aureobasidium pullulans]
MAPESAPKRRGWWNRPNISAATRAMAASFGKKKKNNKNTPLKESTPLVIPDDLSLTGACALEPLYGDEPVEAKLEQDVAHLVEPTKKTQDYAGPGSIFRIRNNVFDLPKVKSKPRDRLRSMYKKRTAGNSLTGFFSLPTEIRNQIYGYIFHERLIIIKHNEAWVSSKGTPLTDALDEYRPKGSRSKILKCIRIVNISSKKTPAEAERKFARSRGVSYDGIPGQKPLSREGVNWKTSICNLPLVCKRINAEAAPIMYGTTAFYFDNAQRLRAFLNTVSPTNLACITKLYVHVRVYGIPVKACDLVWEKEHIECWISVFKLIAKKMTNLRAMRVTFTMRSLTDGLKRAFKPVRYNTDWKERAGYMLMLKPLSSLSMLKDLRVVIKAADDYMQQFQEGLAHMLYSFWRLANIQPIHQLKIKVEALHQQYFQEMHHGLEKAMKDVARSEKVDKSFAPVCLAVRQYMDFMLDPVGSMLMMEYEKKKEEEREEAEKGKEVKKQKGKKSKL